MTVRRLAFRTRAMRGGLHWAAVALLGVALMPQVGTAYQAEEELLPESNGVGLQGLWPFFAPDSLSESAFEDLTGPWEELGAKVAERVQEFYEQTGPTVASQRRQIDELRRFVTVLAAGSGHTGDSRQRAQLAFLAGQLERRLDLAEAVLDLLAPLVLDSPRGSARHAVAELDAWLADREHAESWRRYFQIEKLTAALQAESTEDEARPVITAALARLTPPTDATAAARDVLESTVVTNLATALRNLLKGFDAPESPDALEKLRRALSRPHPEDEFERVGLLPKIEQFETSRLDSQATAAQADELRAEFRKVAELAPDGGAALGAVLQKHYFNFDLHVTAPEDLLQRYARQRRRDFGYVCEYILGAKVTGTRVSDSVSDVDLVPNMEAAELHLLIDGVADSDTVATKDPIQVFGTGRAYFSVTKRITVDNAGFHAEPAEIGVRTESFPNDASTPLDCVPLVGPLVSNYVVQEAIRRKPQTNAIARRKVASRVTCEIDRRIGQALYDADTELRTGPLDRLARQQLEPQISAFRTSDTMLLGSSRHTRIGESAGGRMPLALVEPTGLTVHAHENLLSAALGRARFAGRTMTEAEVRQEFSRFLQELVGRELNVIDEPPTETAPLPEVLDPNDPTPDAGKLPDRFVFAEKDAVRVLVERGEVRLILRAAFLLEDRDIPTHLVSVPLYIELAGEDVVIRRAEAREIKVAPLEGGGGFGQIGRTVAIRKKLEEVIPETRRVDRVIEQQVRGETERFAVQRVTAANGWISTWLVPLPKGESTPPPLPEPANAPAPDEENPADD